jgi:hypothetical protein
MIDTNVFRMPAVSQWEHVEDQLMMWGHTLIGLRQYRWRYKPPKSKEIAYEIFFVPALGMRGKALGFQFFTHQLIELESLEHEAPY